MQGSIAAWPGFVFGLLAWIAAAHGAASDHPYLSVQALRQIYGDAGGRVMNIRGVEVYYKDEGQGPAVLLVHGSACSQRSWDEVASQLTANYRVIRYDVPGQGLSGNVPANVANTVAPEQIAEDLLDHLKISHVTAIGFSSGGTLVVALAAARPTLVDRLILSNAPADPVVTTHLHVSPALQAAQTAAAQSGFQDQTFWDAFLDFFAGAPSRITAVTRRQFYDMNRRQPDPRALSLVAKVADHARAVQAMASVQRPALLIWGDRDPLLPLAASYAMRDYLKNTVVSEIVLSGVGHYPPVEVPARFAQITRAFIEAAWPVNK